MLKEKLFYNNVVFRLIAPPLFGLMMYLLILMFFDSIGMLAENFFSREVLFIIGLSYLFFELNRLIIVLLNTILSAEVNLKLRIIVQYLSAIAITIIAISFVLHAYFTYIEGFSTISTELITFNSLFLFAAIFYHLFFFSLLYLNRKNDALVEKEKNLRQNLEIELHSFKYHINPDLLFQSLEIIISELHHDKKSADDLINNLSKIYRYTLDNKHNDLVSLKNEMESLTPFSEIMKAKYGDYFNLYIQFAPDTHEKNLVPGTLNLLLERAFSENIISKTLKLDVRIKAENEKLEFSYRKNPKITIDEPNTKRMQYIAKAYSYYSDPGIKEQLENGHCTITLPLLEIEEE